MKHYTALTTLLTILVTLIVMSFISRNSATTQSTIANSVPQETASKPLNKRTKADEFAEFTKDGPQGPAGLWGVAARPDPAQLSDLNMPVILVSTQSMAGEDRWANVVVSKGAFENRSAKAVKNVQLRWDLRSTDNSSEFLQGSTPMFEMQLFAGNTRLKKIPFVNFAKIARPLFKNGQLNGEYLLTLSVEAVRFEDGETWKQAQAIASIKTSTNLRGRSTIQKERVKNLREKELRAHAEYLPPQSPCPDTLCSVGPVHGEAQCWHQPSSAGSACRKYDCNGIFCLCDNVLCGANCPDRDNDGWTLCEGDCDDEPSTGSNVNPSMIEFTSLSTCTDGRDNDCDPDTEMDCANNLCSGQFPQQCATPSPTPTPTPQTQAACEQAAMYWNFLTGTCNSTPQECPGFCEEPGGIDLDLCQYEFGCPQGFQAGDSRTGQCCLPAPCPVVVDVDGSGFQFTNAINGVKFDIDGDGDLDHISWTTGSSTNAWLVLDRNGNGVIDNGTELFGNVTQQTVPQGEQPNGFLALSKYDRPSDGGNGDGVIDQRDAIYSSLQLWQDSNHNGISESSELRSLAVSGVATIELDYKLSKKTDEYGNQFRYRAKVKDRKGSDVGRWAWDIFLKMQ